MADLLPGIPAPSGPSRLENGFAAALPGRFDLLLEILIHHKQKLDAYKAVQCVPK